MGIGAVFGAILTMYTAVATRAREIATLRALGFNTGSVLVSVLAESMVLGAIGGVIGGAAAYLAFNGYQTSTMNFQTFSQVAFAFRVTPQLLAMGLFYALLMGLVGGLFPAIRAARLPIPSRSASCKKIGVGCDFYENRKNHTRPLFCELLCRLRSRAPINRASAGNAFRPVAGGLLITVPRGPGGRANSCGGVQRYETTHHHSRVSCHSGCHAERRLQGFQTAAVPDRRPSGRARSECGKARAEMLALRMAIDRMGARHGRR